MSSYGKVINGGAQVRTADGGSINDKLSGFKGQKEARKTASNQILGEFWKQPVPVQSTPKVMGVKGGKPTR